MSEHLERVGATGLRITLEFADEGQRDRFEAAFRRWLASGGSGADDDDTAGFVFDPSPFAEAEPDERRPRFGQPTGL